MTKITYNSWNLNLGYKYLNVYTIYQETHDVIMAYIKYKSIFYYKKYVNLEFNKNKITKHEIKMACMLL